jgi:hypothetical protein
MQETLLREPLVLVSKKPLPDRVPLADLVKHRLVMGSAPTHCDDCWTSMPRRAAWRS